MRTGWDKATDDKVTRYGTDLPLKMQHIYHRCGSKVDPNFQEMQKKRKANQSQHTRSTRRNGDKPRHISKGTRKGKKTDAPG